MTRLECHRDRAKTSTDRDEQIITYERGAFYAALCFCAMFAFMIGWMVVTW